ncbi:MAG: pitrilysin family protein, partial [Pseudomonadota bacterium]
MSDVALTTLPNGFRVVTERMPGIHSACIGVWIEAGARHEEAGENGVAHFLEHMAFKGTGRRSAQMIAEEIEDVGGHLNAYTSRERTAFYARVMKEDVPRAISIIADILLDPSLDPQEMELERGVILSEIGLAHDTPDDIIFDWLQETAFPGHPLGRSILGTA